MRPLVRRLLFPIVILGVAWALTVYTRQAATQQRAIVAAFGEDLGHGGSWAGTDQLLVATLRPRLTDWQGVTVEIRDGDGGPVPDGSASHVAILRRGGLAWLGLRCRYDPDPARMAIVGFFEP